MYMEIYIHVFAIIKQPTWHIASVLCKKMKQHWLKFHASGQCSIRVEPRGMVQPIIHNLVHWKQDGSDHTMWYRKVKVGNFRWTTYGSANRSCNDVNKIAAPFSTSWIAFCLQTLEGIWNNYVDMEQKIMQIRFIISLCTCRYISLGDLTWKHKVSKSKYKLIQTTLGEKNILSY